MQFISKIPSVMLVIVFRIWLYEAFAKVTDARSGDIKPRTKMVIFFIKDSGDEGE
jgi:hypothetical protein